MPEVSVVLPTYNRKERLVACLERLAAQTLPRHRFEVIVVSDGSTDGTADAARAAAARLALDATVLETPNGGPGVARNRGVARARAPILAFVDDDVEVDPGWLEAGLARFSAEPDVGGVEGRTEPVLGDTSLYTGNIVNLAGGLYPTCNLFYTRAAFDRVGGFDEAFRHSREDSDLAFRVLDAGYRIVFEPRARAAHRSHRSSVLRPLAMATTLPDNVRLQWKHPGRDLLRRMVYRSDVIKILTAVAALVLALLGKSVLAMVPALVFVALVARTMARELVFPRVLRPDRLLPLALVYAALPFASVGYWARGRLQLRALGPPPPRRPER